MAEQQYTKFEFKDFRNKGNNIIMPSSEVKEDSKFSSNKDLIIDEIIENHISQNIISNDKTQHHDEYLLEPSMDVEEIKEESYKKGYDQAISDLAPKLKQITDDNIFKTILEEKLNSINPKFDINDRIFGLASNVIKLIAKKLHLMIEPDFDSIILGEMLPIVSKYYKTGSIKLHVNPERVDYSNNLFKISSLPEDLVKNIIIISEETMALNNCSIEWDDTVLKYNQEELVKDVEKMLELLNVKVKN